MIMTINDEIKEITDTDNDNESKFKKVKCSNPDCKKVVEFQHKHQPKNGCPFCNDILWNKPEDERKLFILQEKYLKNRDKKILGEMYSILKSYAKKIIVKMVKNKYFFKIDQLEMKAHDSANKIINYYLTKPEFRIDTSFGGYFKWPIRNVLYGDKEEENADSLNCMIDSENELTEYLPNISSDSRDKMSSGYDIEDSLIEKNSNIVNQICNVSQKIINKIAKDYGELQALYCLVGLKNKIKKQSNNFMDSYYLFCGLECQKHIENAIFLIYKILKNNIS